MSNSLEERLKTHSTAFDGLLSLIPAKFYYDDATQDQWQQKKKSKQEIQQNKRAKLDPTSRDDANEYSNSHASAKDVMDNKSKTAKKVTLPSKAKLPKPIVEDDESDVEIPDMDVDQSSEEDGSVDSSQELDEKEASDSLIHENSQLVFDDEGNEVAAGGPSKTVDATKNKESQKNNKKELSLEEKKKRKENMLKLREKLADKINTLKEKRKAPGSKTGPAKSRDQILEERKRKDELRRQEKLKRKLSEVNDEDDDEASDSDSDDDIDAKQDKAVLYGNITFNDGSRLTSDLSKIRSTAEKKKLKGPANNDIKAHLLKLEKKKQKLSQLSPEEQKKQTEKDQWQRVLSQAEGVKMKDDEKLLKKALKRKEKQKLKSEIEWKERKQIVKDTISARLKRREENLKARKDNKGKKGKQQPRLRKFTGTANKFTGGKKKRAGFEGNAKSNKSKK